VQECCVAPRMLLAVWHTATWKDAPSKRRSRPAQLWANSSVFLEWLNTEHIVLLYKLTVSQLFQFT